jgi:hypothetical protein
LGYSITGISVSYSGSGYSSAPTVIIDSIPVHLASGEAFIDSSGFITGISMLAVGSGYGPTHPEISLSGGAPALTGSGIAQTGSGQITGTFMTSHGYDYESVPTITLSEGDGALSAVMATGGYVEAVLSTGLALTGVIGSYEKSFSGMWDFYTGIDTFANMVYFDNSSHYDSTTPKYYNPLASVELVASGNTNILSQVVYNSLYDNLELFGELTISGSGIASEPVSDVMQSFTVTGML